MMRTVADWEGWRYAFSVGWTHGVVEDKELTHMLTQQARPRQDLACVSRYIMMHNEGCHTACLTGCLCTSPPAQPMASPANCQFVAYRCMTPRVGS